MDPTTGRAAVLGFGVGRVLLAAIGLARTATLTRLLPPDLYGVLAVALGVGTMAATAAGSWLEVSVRRFVPGWGEGGAGHHLTTVGHRVGAGTGLVTLAGALGFGVAPGLATAIAILAALGVSYRVRLAYTQASLRTLPSTVADVIAGAVGAGLAVAVASTAFASADLLVLAAALGYGAGLLVLVCWRRSERTSDPGSGEHRGVTWRVAARYGLPLTAWIVAAGVMDVSDRWILAALRSDAEAGVYAATYGLFSVAAMTAVAPIHLALAPRLVVSWERDGSDGAADRLAVLIGHLSLAGALAVMWSVVVAPYVVRAVLGPEFRTAVAITPVVVAAVALWHISLYLQKPQEFAERTGELGRVAVAAAVTNVLFNLATVPTWGFGGAALGSLVAYTLYAVVVGQRGRRILPWDLSRVPLSWILALVTVAALSWVLLREPTLGKHVVVLVLAISVSVAPVTRLVRAMRGDP